VVEEEVMKNHQKKEVFVVMEYANLKEMIGD